MGQFEVSDAAVNLAMMSLRDQTDEGAKDVISELHATVDKLLTIMSEEAGRQFEDLGLRAAQLGIDLVKQLEVWQLPSEMLGIAAAGGGGPQDVNSLKKEVEELKRLLRAANERIAYLESANGVNRAQQQIATLRKQMQDNRGGGGGAARGVPVDPKSKACVIS